MDKFVVKTKRKASKEEEEVEESDNTKKIKTVTNGKEEETEEKDEGKSIVEWLTLPLTTLKTNSDYEKYFDSLSDFLLNEVVLQVNHKPHRLVEIEYYFTNVEPVTPGEPLVHNDPFTHCDAVQKTLANWYFHKSGNSYRGGTYKGLDITIGQGEKHIGGILIRSIETVDSFNPKFVCGPCKSVDHILEVCSAPSVKDMVEDLMKKELSVVPKSDDKKNLPILYLKKSPKTLEKREVYKSGRVGLHMKKPLGKAPAELQKTFVFKNYRYFTQPKKVFKGTHYAVSALYHQGKTAAEIGKLLSTKAATIEKFINLYEQGKTKKNGDSFIGKSMSDDEICIAYGALAEYLTK